MVDIEFKKYQVCTYTVSFTKHERKAIKELI